ncbi:TRAP transporter small permease [Octadecabacter ascidiaceicola]|uniref:TRAP transporter small permease protein n=1 Tax=Octadecabacter ascidiaceicola TaxID=1655543 RepID=A0A238KHI6_9RHOB|nr:TRAP transporter small permease subunit [Octadecabacter ascidiaceicola]SMX42285.1 Tripartite ATP-independent periplasmic transporters, DctQ component [Octadecabacter ascidiaceicola]
MKTVFRWVSRVSDAIAATLLAVIFFTFLLQIATRYAPKIIDYFGLAETFPALGAIQPLGWTLELIAILWVWVIFFSCAFVVREWDHVKFDIIYLSVSRRTRTIFAVISAVAIVAGMLYALLPTLDYIDWMKIRKTSTVRNPFTGGKIPMRTIFSVYGAFMIVVAIRYAWLAIDTIRNGPPKTELEVVLEAEAAAEAEKPS